jgi:ABC-2 type transport system ATP-binding protein
MGIIAGLVSADGGSATVLGRPYRGLAEPMRAAGFLLDPRAVHPRRRARHHLMSVAAAQGLPMSRVDEVLEMAGLAQADRRCGGLSLGMLQRLGIGTALLGDPQVLVLDEPANGLDLQGVQWLRGLLREFAGRGRTILLSSHLMGEIALIADRLVIIDRGRLVAATTVPQLTAAFEPTVRVSTPDPQELRLLLDRLGARTTSEHARGFEVRGATAAQIGDAAAAAGVRLHELHTAAASLEDAYLSLVERAGRREGDRP